LDRHFQTQSAPAPTSIVQENPTMTTSSATKETAFQGVRIQTETTLQFDEVLGRLRKLTKAAPLGEVIGLASTSKNEDDYARQIEKRFVGESGFMVFAEIDHGTWIKLFGLRRRSVRWILGNPLISITMMRHDISAGLFAPVELLITSKPDGRTTILYVRPSSLICPPGSAHELVTAAAALDEKLAALVNHAAGG
jgi:uncharacterized protein (DUF302 family)